MQAVILAGGEGRRLKAISGDRPKPLVPIAGRPLLDHQLQAMRRHQIKDVVILVGYGADEIVNFVGSGQQWGMTIRCLADGTPRGTAGAVIEALPWLQPQFLTVYGDTIFDIDFGRMIASHRQSRAAATLLLHPNDHPHDSDIVETDQGGLITAFHPYPHAPGQDLPNLVNAGMYVIERSLFEQSLALPERPDFGKHLFPALLARGMALNGYCSPEYIKDAGTPDRHRRVEADLLAGRVAAKSLSQPCPAVFLDRDGTINEEVGRINHPDQLRLLPGAGAAISRLNHSHYRTVVVTNQGVLARGECDEAGLETIHRRMAGLLGQDHAYLDAIYYCPHLPESGYDGERRDLKMVCDCRKPAPGMVTKAGHDLNLAIAESWIIGDSTGDIMVGQNLGVSTILLQSGHGGRDGKYPALPDFERNDLADAVQLILTEWPKLQEADRPLLQGLEPGALILIGGQARSGKSTRAGCLSRSLRLSGRNSVVIQADRWLRSEDQRAGPSVLDRYDLDGLVEFVQRARAHPGRYALGRYDRNSRRRQEDAAEIDIAPGAVIIVEGVPVLECPKLLDLAQLSFFCDRPKAQRRDAFFADYQRRGWNDQAVAQLWAEREDEEMALIERGRDKADHIVELPS
jgi:histidinol-phosphate phosphatase family protein